MDTAIAPFFGVCGIGLGLGVVIAGNGLPESALAFLEDLAANNNRDWFQENKKRYERELRDPWKAFVTEVLAELEAVHADFKGIAAKDCIFRIHRDTRFSADKTPYKLNVAAGISSGGKKSSEPGVSSDLPNAWKTPCAVSKVPFPLLQ